MRTLLLLGLVVQQVAAVVPLTLHARPKGLAKRSFDVSLQNYYPGQEYFVAVQVGTPPQDLELIVDTGSSDLWFFGSGGCTDSGASSPPCVGGTFSTSKSKTYQLVNQGAFSIMYGDNTGVQGDYIQDTFYIGGLNVTGQIMGLATSDNGNGAGIMGIGFDENESAVTNSGASPYPNLPDQLVSQGLIKTKSFSLYLDDVGSTTGTLLFGGYDTAKFYGDLTMLPLQNDPVTGVIDVYWVEWTDLVITDSNGSVAIASASLPAPALLDSGTFISQLPTDLFNVLVSYFNVDTSSGVISCDVMTTQGSLDFRLGDINGPHISVPFAELALPLYSGSGDWQTDSSGAHICRFGFSDAGSAAPIFGQTFLRSAYVLYDLDNQAVGIAQSRFGATTSNIVEYTGPSGQNIQSLSDAPLTQAVPAAATPIASGVVIFPTTEATVVATEPTAKFPNVAPSLTQVGQSAGRVGDARGTVFAVSMSAMAACLLGGMLFL